MIQANRVSARHGWQWVLQGYALFRKSPVLWLAMAFVYLVIAILLSQIPFIGWLILILLTPLFLLGALPLSETLAGPGLPAHALPPLPVARNFRARSTWHDWALYLRDLLLRAARRLLHGLSSEEKLLPLMVVSTLLLGGVVAISLLAQLLKVGGAAVPAVLSGSIAPMAVLSVLVGLLIVLAFEALLLMAFLYVVPLILFRGEHPLPAIESSFSAALNNYGAFGVFVSVFALAGELSRLVFHAFSHLSTQFGHLAFYHEILAWLVSSLLVAASYLSILVFGMLLLPILAAGLYASYLDLYSRPRT